LRWGKDWYERSLHHLCSVWDLDRNDTEWNLHARYRTEMRRRALTLWSHQSAASDLAAAPVERLVGWWNARR
jgi:hypothetical protein